MKMTLLGPNKKEVNETVETLINQNTILAQRNDKLEEDVKVLKIELEEVKSENEKLIAHLEAMRKLIDNALYHSGN